MSIKITIGKQDSILKANLAIRKSLDGNLIITSHEDVDIVLIPKKSKILVLSKDIMADKIYNVQDRVMKFLSAEGVIDQASIRSGNVYGSLEAKVLPADNEKISSIDMIVLLLDRWIEKEKPHFSYRSAKEEEFIDTYTEPDEEASTELGEIPHSKTNSTVKPKIYPDSLYRSYMPRE